MTMIYDYIYGLVSWVLKLDLTSHLLIIALMSALIGLLGGVLVVMGYVGE